MNIDEQKNNHNNRNKVTRLAVIFTIMTVLATLLIGYQAYSSSQAEMLKNIYGRNLDLVRTFGNYANKKSKHTSGDDYEVLSDLRKLWKSVDKSYQNGFLCVISATGKLTLHTKVPTLEGSDVGNNLIHPDNPIKLLTLVNSKRDYIGPYLSTAGQNQVAAFAYVPSIKSVVSIHVPYQQIESQINQTTLPWLIGLIIIGGVLLPFLIWILHRCYINAQNELQVLNFELCTEITERKKIEHELEKHRNNLQQLVDQRTESLQSANKELESFSYSVSHDLRSPLRSIDGFSLALLEDFGDKLDEQGKDYLNRVRASTVYMGKLIDDLLQLSRMTRSPLVRKSIDLTQTARNIIDNLQKNDSHRQVDVIIQNKLITFADYVLIKVLLENLLNNAWKYTSKNTYSKIEFGKIEENHQTVYFVKDNGIGFDMEYSHKIFNPFSRLHAKEDFPGTGIGLASVQRIIQRHLGKIWSQAEVNKGATFFFTLPAAEDNL